MGGKARHCCKRRKSASADSQSPLSAARDGATCPSHAALGASHSLRDSPLSLADQLRCLVLQVGSERWVGCHRARTRNEHRCTRRSPGPSALRPNLAFDEEGVRAPVYRGHLGYRDEVFISPSSFFPVCEGWLPELRNAELLDGYVPEKATIDADGDLIDHRYDLGRATCSG